MLAFFFSFPQAQQYFVNENLINLKHLLRLIITKCVNICIFKINCTSASLLKTQIRAVEKFF